MSENTGGVGMALDKEERNSVQDMGETPHQIQIHVSLSMNTIESLFDILLSTAFGAKMQPLVLIGL